MPLPVSSQSRPWTMMRTPITVWPGRAKLTSRSLSVAPSFIWPNAGPVSSLGPEPKAINGRFGLRSTDVL